MSDNLIYEMNGLILRQEATRRTLDMLRHRRISQGGVGAPLVTEAGKEISPIIITDEDLKLTNPVTGEDL